MPQQYSYRPQMNRNVTRKWAEARHVDYDGDDWGGESDPYDDAADPTQPTLSQGGRSFTNPTSINTAHRMSFDRGPEQRVFSAGGLGPSSGFPSTTQPTSSQFRPLQSTSSRDQFQPRPLEHAGRTSTDSQRIAEPAGTTASAPASNLSRDDRTRTSEPAGRTSIDSQRRSGLLSNLVSSITGNRNTPQTQPSLPRDQYQSRTPEPSGRASMDSFRTAGSSSQAIAPATETRSFPPRKSSLSQPDVPNFAAAAPTQIVPQSTEKPLPFPRPSDIYRRMDEEKEKERRSQESSRPSLDSVQRDATEVTPRPRTNLDTVPERKSEYGMAGLTSPPVAESTARSNSPSQINTNVSQEKSFPSASSLYTDRPDSIATDSQLPSRNVSHHDSSIHPTRPALPQVPRTSTFGSDFFQRSGIVINSSATSRQPGSSAQQTSTNVPIQPASANNAPYRNLVQNAFQSENTTSGSPVDREDSLLRSNTTSTSQISPIVGRRTEPDWDTGLARNVEAANEREDQQSAEQTVEELGAPRRLGTNRRDSPSPARRPMSVFAPSVSEPQSAVLSPSDADIAKDTATKAQLIRPGPAILVHQKGLSSESVPRAEKSSISGVSSTIPTLRNKESQMSEVSDVSTLRTASEEWRDWSRQRQDFNAKYGFMDSNPTTPGIDSGMSSPAPPFASMDRNINSQLSNTSDDTLRGMSASSNLPTAARPLMGREESFRPSLPGGWESSNSIQRPSPLNITSTNSTRSDMPNVTRSDSVESIPTAGAPREANWRSQYAGPQGQYTGPQGQPFAAAQAAGNALAGIFNGPSLTGRRDDSEVSSINEHDDNPAGRNRDSTLFVRDFASSSPPAVPDQYATRDFASASSPAQTASQATPKAFQQPFAASRGSTKSTKSAKSTVSHPRINRLMDDGRGHSPSRESERWWSDEEDEDAGAHAPTPLRTKRLSTVSAQEKNSPLLSHPPRFDSTSHDPDQLESDIMKSLTPKSSSVGNRGGFGIGHGPHLSPTRTNENRAGSPPFSAAALALSPARSRSEHAIQEQNTFKPLVDPDMSASHETPAEALRDLNSLDQTTPSKSFTLTGRDSNPAATSQIQSTTPESSLVDSTRDVQGAPQIPHPTRSATKEFSIMPNTFDTPTMFPPSASNRELAQSSKPSLLSGDQYDATNEARVPDPTQMPSTTVSERQTPATSTGSHPTLSTLDQGSTFPRSNDVSTTTAPKPVTVAEQVKQTPDPIVTPSHPSPQPSLSRSISHDSVSAPSPIVPPSSQAPRHMAPTNYEANRSFPVDKVPIETIFGMGTAQQRIQAYHENREVYAQPVGQLENWLSYMNRTDNADAFTALPRAKTEYGTPNSKIRRDDSTPSGAKQIQEDGKKLLASAGKMGAKASVLGKGLFSKGKEKLRTVSANQKGGSMSRKNSDMPEYSRSVSATSTNVPPQLPTPTMATPIEASSFSGYFPHGQRSKTPPPGTRAAVAPPFSPISEVSTNPNELERSMSEVSRDRSPQSNTTARQTFPTASVIQAPKTTRDNDKRTSAGAVSALESERDEGRVSADLLNPNSTANDRVNSSVSDVSSVSDTPDNRRSLAARTISPPIEHQTSRDGHSSVSPLPSSQISNMGMNNQRSQHAPSYSTTMASMQAQAVTDRTGESDLPAYGQSGESQASKIAPGTQVVPIARLRQDQEVRAEEPRPFSFVGSESLLHTGHGTNQSIDNPGVNIGSTGLDSRVPDDHQAKFMSDPTNQPTSASNQPVERAGPTQPSRIVTQAQAQQGYRIPGPYGHELRSPRPKNSSPMAEQFRTPSTTQPPEETFASGAVPHKSVTSEYTPFPPQPTMHQPSQPVQQAQQQSYTSNDVAAARPGISQEYSEGSSRPGARSSSDRYRDDSRDRDYSRERDRDYSRDRGRGGISKLSALFGTRSRSRSERVQKEKSRDQRPDNSRRNSLFKLGGGRQSMSREESYSKPLPRPQDEDSERNSEVTAQSSPRPTGGIRRLSKDLLKNDEYSQSDVTYDSPIQHGFATTHKRKRLSALFGKSQTQVPTRATTAPLVDEPQPELGPVYGPERPDERKRAPKTSRHVSFEVDPTSRQSDVPPRMPNLPDQLTRSHDTDRAARRSTDNYRQYSNDQSQAPPSLPMPAGLHGSSRQNTSQSDSFDPYNNWFPAQKTNTNEQHDQYSLHSNTPFARPTQVDSPYQHENRPYGHDNGNQYQHDQARPVLPRLDTGDNRSSSADAFPASAPPVPSSYLQTRQGQGDAPLHSRTLPQDTSHQQYQQLSFPQPSSISEYQQPPTTRAARDISHNADAHDRTNQGLFNDSQNYDYNDRQMASPLPMSAPVSRSNAFNQPSSGAVGSTIGYPRVVGTQSNLPVSGYNQQSSSRITPHVANLHVRSRSPKLGRRSSEDLNHEFETTGNSLAINPPHSATSVSPVAGLGTFSNKKVSPMGGMPRHSEDQEKPWAITLPADEEERRRREYDPQSATSSRARETKRLMLERSSAANSAIAHPPMPQAVADLLESHSPIQQTSRADHQDAFSAMPVTAQQSRSHDYEPSTSYRPDVTQQGQGSDTISAVLPKHGRRPSRAGEYDDVPVPAIPGTQQVSPPSRRNTPITVGRPTTPSFSLRRDVSLRGKGPRTSTVIDEAGRAHIMSGLTKRSTTPVTIGGVGSGRESLDGGPNRGSTWGSRDITPQHDSTIPGRAPAMMNPNTSAESRSFVPPVPHVHSTFRDQPTMMQGMTARHGEPSVGVGSDSGFAPTAEPRSAATSATTASPAMTTETNPLIRDSALLARDPIIPTTTNMAGPSTSGGRMSSSTDTNPLIRDSNLVTRDPAIPTTTNMPTMSSSRSFGPRGMNYEDVHNSNRIDTSTRDEMPLIPTTSNMYTAPTPVDPSSEFTNQNPLIKDQNLVTRDPTIPTTTNMASSDSPSYNQNREAYHDTSFPANRSADISTNPLIKDSSLISSDPIIPTTSNMSGLSGTGTGTTEREPGTSTRTANHKQLKPLEVYEMMGSRPDGYESEDEPFMSATAYPGQEWQPVFENWED